tara:strand:- start:32 stop:283 length:252 start_codon:yes stop_codon:yes gene_type:complete
MNRQKLAEIKYDLQGQLKMKLHKLEVHSKVNPEGGLSDAFLSGYSLAIKHLGTLVPDWKHENLSNENNPKVFPDEEGGTYDNN